MSNHAAWSVRQLLPCRIPMHTKLAVQHATSHAQPRNTRHALCSPPLHVAHTINLPYGCTCNRTDISAPVQSTTARTRMHSNVATVPPSPPSPPSVAATWNRCPAQNTTREQRCAPPSLSPPVAPPSSQLCSVLLDELRDCLRLAACESLDDVVSTSELASAMGLRHLHQVLRP